MQSSRYVVEYFRIFPSFGRIGLAMGGRRSRLQQVGNFHRWRDRELEKLAILLTANKHPDSSLSANYRRGTYNIKFLALFSENSAEILIYCNIKRIK